MMFESKEDRSLLGLGNDIYRTNRGKSDTPLYQRTPYDADIRIPTVQNVSLFSNLSASGATHMVITWVDCDDPNVESYELWVGGLVQGNQTPQLVAAFPRSPAAFSLKADAVVLVTGYLRTRMKNGLLSSLNNCPTVTFTVAG